MLRQSRGFTLVELLVTIGVISILMALITPALSGARSSARAVRCVANLRQSFWLCREYADHNRGDGPAIGTPWTDWPNWAIVVLRAADESRTSASDPFENADSDGDAPINSILVCPEIDLRYSTRMSRTYAMNGTGHAGAPGDPDDFDADPAALTHKPSSRPVYAHINFDEVPRPSDTPLLADSLVAFIPDGAPPPTRTSSVIDFRNATHVAKRLGRAHMGARFHTAAFDGSVRSFTDPHPHWTDPLP